MHLPASALPLWHTGLNSLCLFSIFVFWNARPWQHKITVMKIFSPRFALSTSLSGFWRRQWWSSPRTTWWWSPTLFLPSISSPTGRWNSIKDSCKSSRTGITANNCFRTLTYNNASNTDAGLQMTLVFKRRLLNAILTVYLPTILILTICYATNFFKGFFFELSLLELSWVECLWFRAIVTVNLTSLLVLTTLFISVSSSLPQTAYVKMVGSICISRFFFFFSFLFIFVFLDLYSYLYHHDTRRLTSGWSLHNLFLGWRWRICIFCKKNLIVFTGASSNLHWVPARESWRLERSACEPSW